MASKFCTHKLEEYEKLIHLHRTFMLFVCILNLTFSVVATLGNFLVIRALRKSSSVPATMKKMFLSLAFSDLAMGSLGQAMFGTVTAVMLTKRSGTSEELDFLCPHVITVSYFFLFLLGCASFLNVIAIAIDRLLAISLHLRYQELVTPKRVLITLWSLWVTSALAAVIFVLLPKNNNRVSDVLEFVGFIVATVAYIRIYKAVRYHQDQMRVQPQATNQRTQRTHQEKKSAMNAMFVYGVFLICYFPYLCCTILLMVDNLRMSFLIADHLSLFLILLNSSLNPAIYCWRYREIRRIMKTTVKEIFRMGTAQ